MNKIKLPIYGEITLNETDWEYKYCYNLDSYEHQGLSIDLDVNFKSIDEPNVEKAANALKEIDTINKIGMQTYKTDYQNEGETLSYITEWAEDIFEQIFSEEEFREFIEHTDISKPLNDRLFDCLRLVRMGIYADSDTEFVTLDYAFGYDITKGFRDNMLVVKLDQEYNLTEIVTEG